MNNLKGLRIAVLATDGFEESELTEPIRALREAGARPEVVADKPGEIQGFRHHDKSIRVRVDQALDDANPYDYEALLLPGGALNADALRAVPKALAFVRAMFAAGRPAAVICHAPWVLVSAGVVKGRTLTSYHTIKDDLRGAGAIWIDRETVVDDNLLTSRSPKDLPAFNREMIALFGRAERRAVA